jgi:hypothetical protein
MLEGPELGRLLPLPERLHKAGQLVERVHVHVEVWLACEERSSAFQAAMLRHVNFLVSTLHAHRVAAIVELCAMLETGNNGSFSLVTLAMEMAEAGHISRMEAERVATALKGQPAHSKVVFLRNTAIAHRSAKVTFDEAFARQKLSPNEVRALMTEMGSSANMLLGALGQPKVTMDDQWVASFTHEALKRLAQPH